MKDAHQKHLDLSKTKNLSIFRFQKSAWGSDVRVIVFTLVMWVVKFPFGRVMRSVLLQINQSTFKLVSLVYLFIYLFTWSRWMCFWRRRLVDLNRVNLNFIRGRLYESHWSWSIFPFAVTDGTQTEVTTQTEWTQEHSSIFTLQVPLNYQIIQNTLTFGPKIMIRIDFLCT